MAKPVLGVKITTLDRKTKKVMALFDSGSSYTIVRQDRLPPTKAFFAYKVPDKLGLAKKRTSIKITGEISLIITIRKKKIKSLALVSPDLGREMIIGAQTMQAWDISIKNQKGKTKVIVGHDMRDPDIREVAII